jgi:glycosyltransferase involved in cell wall biosynthesis
MNPFVSIVIPVYNGANYAGEAIESALEQTYGNVEVIVVNDGSSDGGATREAALKYEPHIRYIEKANGGVATALNAGIAAMRGDLFSWLSHDDLYKPDKVARQVDAFRSFGARCVVIGDFELMDARRKFLHRVSISGRNLAARPLDAVFCGLINGCALLVPRDLFEEAGGFEPGLPTTQDYHLWYRIARLVPFVHCPHSDVRQRSHVLQASKQAAHLHEASRMFVQLIDSTPFELMRAYDGSELRFLLRIRGALHAYAGLLSYLDFRIGQLFQHFQYSVALCAGSRPERTEAARERLQRMKHAPIEIVPIHAPLNNGVEALGNQVRAAHDRISAGTVVFLPADNLPSDAQLESALRLFAAAGADVARPRQPADGMVLSYVVARRDALPAIGETLTPNWRELASRLQVTGYSFPEPANGIARQISKVWLTPRRGTYRQLAALAPTLVARAVHETARGGSALARSLSAAAPSKRISEALLGRRLVSFHWGLPERTVAEALRGMQQPGLPTILFLSHGLGGGAHRHIAELTQALNGKANCIAGYGRVGGSIRLCRGSMRDGGGLVFRIPAHLGALARILRRAGVDRADVHHTMGFEKEAELLLDALGIPFDITLVDYHLIANNPHLCFEDGCFVGDVRLQDPECGMLRPAPLPILRKAGRVIAISRDLGARVQRLCPDLPVVPALQWHESSSTHVRHVFVPRLWGNEPLRVIISGRIAENKGRQLIKECARLVSRRKLPVRFHVSGRMDLTAGEQDELADVLTIRPRFDFDSERFSESLGAIAPHLAWLPAQVPETWSYVLSDFMESALPIASAAIGAIPERCYGRPATWLLPWDASAESWVELFLKLHATQLTEPPRWTPIDHLPPARMIYFDEYLRPVKAPPA